MATIETKRITELPVATSIGGTEAIPLVQTGTTKQTTLQTIADQMLIGPTGATGPAGADGATGSVGATGPTGAGVAAGGTTSQVLAKVSDDDYDTEWVDQSGGGGGGMTNPMTNQYEMIFMNSSDPEALPAPTANGQYLQFNEGLYWDTGNAYYIDYNNGTSGLTAINVQAAIDELKALIDAL